MPRLIARTSASRHRVRRLVQKSIVAAVLATFVAGVAGCGQRGPLYLPDKENPDKRR